MIKVRNIETGKVFDVIKVSGEYWIDETGYIESEQLGITWELIDDYKQLYEQQKQRADELEEKIKVIEKLHDAAIKSAGTMFEDEKQRADELQNLIERFLYANRESDVYAICSEEELLSEYERIK